jgi:hypothetical protein
VKDKKYILQKSIIISTVVVLFILSCGGSINPLTWKGQLERRISPQIMIQPGEVAEFSMEIGRDGEDLSQLTELIKSKITYSDDLINHASIDHLPTTKEVLSSRKDDCDGRAVLMCSVLRYRGYDAYAVVGPSHAWVEVHTDTVVSLDDKGKDWYVKFNEASVEWKLRPLILLILEEFILLTLFFFALIYSYEMGVLAYLQEFLGYFKYILLFFIGYLLIGVLILITKSTVWVLGLTLIIIAFLLVVKLVSKLR